MDKPLDILDVAKKSAPYLTDVAKHLILRFLKNQINPDGGLKGKSMESDVYYTLFGVSTAVILDNLEILKDASRYIVACKEIEALDFVHLTAFIRCASILKSLDKRRDNMRFDPLFTLLEKYRADDGGYSYDKNDLKNGSIYASFLAGLAYQGSGRQMPEPEKIRYCIEKYRTFDQAYAEAVDIPSGTTTVTAAAIIMLKELAGVDDQNAADWLIERQGVHGGFYSSPLAPAPDLLSTASAVFALNIVRYNHDKINEKCLDFAEDLMRENGGFSGSANDVVPDCEYTFYGLLTIGSFLS